MHCQLIVDSFHMSCRGECNEIMINCSLTRKIVWPTSTRSEALKSRIHMSTTKVLAIIYILYLLLSGSLIHDRPCMCTCSYDARNCPLTDCKCINQSWSIQVYLLNTHTKTVSTTWSRVDVCMFVERPGSWCPGVLLHRSHARRTADCCRQGRHRTTSTSTLIIAVSYLCDNVLLASWAPHS